MIISWRSGWVGGHPPQGSVASRNWSSKSPWSNWGNSTWQPWSFLGVEPQKIGGFYPQNGWWKSWKTLWKFMIWGVFPLFFGSTPISFIYVFLGDKATTRIQQKPLLKRPRMDGNDDPYRHGWPKKRMDDDLSAREDWRMVKDGSWHKNSDFPVFESLESPVPKRMNLAKWNNNISPT